MKIRYRFSPYFLSLLKTLYGERCEEVFTSFRKPSPRYFLRVNTLKTTREAVISSFQSKGIEAHKFPHLDEALFIKVKEYSKIPVYGTRIVVDKYTAESVLQGAHVYAPGIVKCQGIRKGNRVTVVDRMGMPIASGTAIMGETEILTLRRGLAVSITHSPFKIPSLRETLEYEKGLIYPQSLPAILTSRILDPLPGEVIADLNCAPGGKVSHICQLTHNKSTIYAMDRTENKITRTQKTLSRLGCKNVRFTVQDTRYVHIDHPKLKVNKCIVDPPCTALGVTPKIYELQDSTKVKDLSAYQKQFINAAAMFLDQGGIMTYSVCTITPEECEEIIRYAVEEVGFKLLPPKYVYGEPGLPGYIEKPQYLQRFHPHLHGIGYFIAKLTKQ